MSALGSLLANYTDSEDEDQNKEEDDEETTRDSVIFPSGPPSHLTHSASGTPNSSKSATLWSGTASVGDLNAELKIVRPIFLMT